jgi:hypothetical protein
MCARWSLSFGVRVVYSALVIAAALVGAVRLHASSEMPGLAAIELVLLALPWSLALGVEPFSRLGWSGIGIIVLGGIALNGLIVGRLAGWAQQSLAAHRAARDEQRTTDGKRR